MARSLFGMAATLCAVPAAYAAAWASMLKGTPPFLAYEEGAKWWSSLVLRAFGIHVTVEGRHHLEQARRLAEERTEGRLVVLANHCSLFDIPVLLVSLGDLSFSFIAKESLFRIPVFGYYIRRAGYVPIRRKAAKGALEALEEAERLLERGRAVLVFPEGTRSRDGTLGAFKRGPLRLARERPCTFLPVHLEGTRRILPPHSLVPRSADVALDMMEPRIGGPFRDRKAEEDFLRELERLFRERSRARGGTGGTPAEGEEEHDALHNM